MRKFAIVGGVALAAFVGVLIGGAAFASDLTARQRQQSPKAEAPYNWSGFWLGIEGGAGIGSSGADASPFSALVPNSPADKVKGWLYGFEIGGRQQAGMFVYGVKANFDWTNISNRSTSAETTRRTFFATQLADTNTSQTNGAKIDWLSTVTANAGIVLWERALLSFNGGFAFGQVKWDNQQNVATTTLTPTGVAFCNAGVISCPNGATSAAESKVKAGWTIGATLEAALGGRWTAKGEYAFVDLGSTGGATGAQKLDVHLGKFGINYRF